MPGLLRGKGSRSLPPLTPPLPMHAATQESVVSYNTWPDGSKPRVKAVATLLQVGCRAVICCQHRGGLAPEKPAPF